MDGREEITVDDVMGLAEDFAELCEVYDETRATCDTYNFSHPARKTP